MDDRASALLTLLIERYITAGQPVGSKTLSKEMGLSPATIRNVMADLEGLGLIQSPHTSAGRIPTPQGYRVFADQLLAVQQHEIALPVRMHHQLSRYEPAKAVASAASLLSNLSQFAGVVLAPRRTQTFKQIDFIRLSETRVLLVIITPSGEVQNRILFVSRDYKKHELQEASHFFNQHFSGMSFMQVRDLLSGELSSLQYDISRLMQAAVEAGSTESDDSEDVVISGESKLLNVTEMVADMDKLRHLFDLFEQKTEWLHLLDRSRQAQGVQIYIGGDSQLVPFDEVSVVTAPYGVDGQVVGTLGVIGPSRMAYDKVIPIVDITARMLSNALSYNA